jgi:hypothetical protein
MHAEIADMALKIRLLRLNLAKDFEAAEYELNKNCDKQDRYCKSLFKIMKSNKNSEWRQLSLRVRLQHFHDANSFLSLEQQLSNA